MKRDLLYQGAILSLVRLEDHWEVVEHAPAVVVLALRDGLVLGVSQVRPAIGATTWELPAGIVEPGEAPEAAARRELAEETQLQGQLQLITQVYSSPGFCTEKLYLFEATHLRTASGEPDEGEALSVQWRKAREVWKEIKSGEVITSASTALGLSYALANSGFRI